MSGFFAESNRQILDVLLGILVKEEVGQRPSLRVGVQALLRVLKPLVVAEERSQRIVGTVAEILLKLGHAGWLTSPMPLQPPAPRRSGVSKYMASPSLNHTGQSLSRVCRPQLKAIWCVALWTIVATSRTASGEVSTWLICADGAQTVATAGALGQAQVVHGHAIRVLGVIADERLGPSPLAITSRRTAYRRRRGPPRGTSVPSVRSPCAPVTVKRRVKPLVQPAAPLHMARDVL